MKKIMFGVVCAALLLPSAVYADSSIVERMKQQDQAALAEESTRECGMGCRMSRGPYYGIKPDFYELTPIGDGQLSPERVEILDLLNSILQKYTVTVSRVKTGKDWGIYDEMRPELKQTLLTMLSKTAALDKVSPNDVRVLTYAVERARDLYVDADLRESWAQDRDLAFIYAYVEGVIQVLDRYTADLGHFADHIPGGPYSWSHQFVLRSLDIFTGPLTPVYAGTIQELNDSYTQRYLELVRQDNQLNLDRQVDETVNIYRQYKEFAAKHGKNNLTGAAVEAMLQLYQHPQLHNNEENYHGFAVTWPRLREFVEQPEIVAADKARLRLQWYQSFMAGIGRLDVSIYQGDFAWYVSHFFTHELQAFAQSNPQEYRQLAAKLLVKLEEEENPKDRQLYNQTIDMLTRAAQGK